MRPGRSLGRDQGHPQPLLLLQVPGKAVTWETITAYISFTNPLPVPLRGGVFTVEGAGLLPVTQIQLQ